MRERLKILIIRTGFNQKEFAERINVSSSALTQFLKGQSKGLNSDTLISIIKEFNVNPTWLLTGDGEMFISLGANETNENDTFDPEFMESVITIVTGRLREEGLEFPPDKFAKLIMYMYYKHKDETDDEGGAIDRDIKEDVSLLKNFM